jgi:hypothetical protein
MHIWAALFENFCLTIFIFWFCYLSALHCNKLSHVYLTFLFYLKKNFFETGFHYVAQASLKLMILLPQLSEYRRYRQAPPHLVASYWVLKLVIVLAITGIQCWLWDSNKLNEEMRREQRQEIKRAYLF